VAVTWWRSNWLYPSETKNKSGGSVIHCHGFGRKQKLELYGSPFMIRFVNLPKVRSLNRSLPKKQRAWASARSY
jgi:hypothetical protein